MALINPIQFLRQVKAEVGKITWPTRKEASLSTLMVVILSFLAAMFFFAVDAGIMWLVSLILGIGK